MKRILMATAVLALLAGTGMANLLVNGDFEQPPEVGWKDSVYLLAGDYRYERSDTFGSGSGYAMKVRKYLAYYASLSQAVPVLNDDMTFEFDARLVWGGGSSTCWPVAAVMVKYLDASGNELGATCYYNHHPSATWLSNDTMHLVEVTSSEWNHYIVRTREELVNNLPGVNPASVAQMALVLFAYDNGT
jgi:opacity protein-like surface antigen